MNEKLNNYDSVLLVGDGDFSFSLALTKQLPLCFITATNLETEELIQKHKNVQDNMKKLQDIGVKVFLGVDATCLETHPHIGIQRYKRIIFNFPHIGGKSNNKKNRALLNNFFKSASKVLFHDGNIMMTLCRGQGGTPADQPQRAWGNSWQVVSMAANSGLILTKVFPFQAELYPEYSSTGFRSQDKGFHTEGGLTHVFQHRDMVPVDPDTSPLKIHVDTEVILCPKYIHNKIQVYRKIQKDLLHPFTQMHDKLLCTVTKYRSTNIVPEDRVPHLVDASELSVQDPEHGAFKVTLYDPFADTKEEMGQSSANTPTSTESQTHFKGSQTENYLRTSIFETLPSWLEDEEFENYFVVTSGLTFKPEVLCPDLPVSIELLVLLRCEESENDVGMKDLFEVVSRMLEPWVITQYVRPVYDQPSIVIKSYEVEFLTDVICRNETESAIVGQLVKISSLKNKNLYHWGFVLFIDRLTYIQFTVKNKSILWNQNINEYLEPNPQMWTGGVVEHKPVSLYPVEFVHDMSFWESPSSIFHLHVLCNIIRDIAGDYVSSLINIETYVDPMTGRVGRCIRLKFQSWDLCLNYDTSWKLQSLIRLATAEKMGVTLR